MNRQYRDISRADAADSAGLTQAPRANPLELLPSFHSKVCNRPIVEMLWDVLMLQPPKSLHLGGLSFHVTGILRFQHDLLDRLPRRTKLTDARVQRFHVAPRHLGTPQKFSETLRAVPP